MSRFSQMERQIVVRDLQCGGLDWHFEIEKNIYIVAKLIVEDELYC